LLFCFSLPTFKQDFFGCFVTANLKAIFFCGKCLKRITEVRIYKRKQEKKRKKELDQESDQEKKKYSR